jgi:hypothetical protein
MMDKGKRPSQSRTDSNDARTDRTYGDVALKAADERHEIERLIREALLANDDIRLRVHARRLVG